MRLLRLILLFCLLGVPLRAGTNLVSIATLNCYWFFGDEDSPNADRPRSKADYELKAGHLVGLLPAEAPLFVGLQEIGNDGDVRALASSATRRYGHAYRPLFVQGKDTATKQDVGAIFDTERGWGVFGQPTRVSDLEKELSKHLVVRLTNAVTSMNLCVVHLRRPMGIGGPEKQLQQNRALLRWVMRHLATDPLANVIILGDFNEGKTVGNPDQSLAVIFKSQPPMLDALSTLPGKVRTHTDGKAYDRIIVSDAIGKGRRGLKLESVQVQEHRHGKGEGRKLYTDHFPVVVCLSN